MKENHMWRPVAELASTQHGAFNRKQAITHGIDAQRLRRAVAAGRIERTPLSDVFVFAAAPNTWMRRHVLPSLVGGAISQDSAAALHLLDGFERTGTQVDVSFERGVERKIPGAKVHRWRRMAAEDITTVDGIRCTSIARTLFELGQRHDRETVESALDSALRKGANPTWIRRTAERLARPGPTGGRTLLDLLDDPSRQGAIPESVLERIIERVLRKLPLPAPIRQYAVELPSGPRRIDLAFPQVKLGIEGHSRTHHFGVVKGERDNGRDVEFAAAGWEIIYVTWPLAHDPDTLRSVIMQAYAARIALARSTTAFR